jgi:hypothetical protein
MIGNKATVTKDPLDKYRNDSNNKTNPIDTMECGSIILYRSAFVNDPLYLGGSFCFLYLLRTAKIPRFPILVLF